LQCLIVTHIFSLKKYLSSTFRSGTKYNPIKHYWGGLERSWNGYLLDSIQTVINRTANFTWRNLKTVTTTLFGSYPKGNNPERNEKKAIEEQLSRSETLPWWDVTIAS